MKHEDIDFELEYELAEIRRTGISRLADLDGLADRLGGFAHDAVSAARIIYREIIGGK
jgi:hypothetical protein